MVVFEAPNELIEEAERRKDLALQWLVDWLTRRDDVLDQIKIDDIATSLETIAAELRRESKEPTSQSAGLALAATVLDDSAEGVRAGDGLAIG